MSVATTRGFPADAAGTIAASLQMGICSVDEAVSLMRHIWDCGFHEGRSSGMVEMRDTVMDSLTEPLLKQSVQVKRSEKLTDLAVAVDARGVKA